ncbi:hypothetical protein I553_3278 [Mycobacterium xenopi 4042]|uniref:Uncharacterized protein n=1 Tax=Mycobacterium xenopi 4042 TaxID=1299334 RepID=X8E6D7_MYCXE|nr:hypothetical protein I553_3278 [Mycobacterium xenopi 4042]
MRCGRSGRRAHLAGQLADATRQRRPVKRCWRGPCATGVIFVISADQRVRRPCSGRFAAQPGQPQPGGLALEAT